MKVLSAAKKHVLSRGTIRCLGEVSTVNTARGCAGLCAFCYARCYTGAPPPDTLLIYPELPAQLRHELDSRRRKNPLPGYVIFSSASDAFVGGPQVLRLTRACLEILLRRDVGVALSTRGVIPDEIIELLAAHRSRVQITIPLASLSEDYTRQWEPGTAPPEQRLFTAQRLQHAGIEPNLRLAPLIPFVNDSTDDLRQLVSAVAALGVKQMMTTLLQLRRGVGAQLEREAPAEARRLVLGSFPSQQHEGHAAEFDHVAQRHALAMLRRAQRIGREHGVRISACRCHNPGLPSSVCPVAPAQHDPVEQPQLFDPK